MLLIVMIVFASGCVQEATDNGTDSPDQQIDQASENEIIDNLDNEIIDDSELIDIGELV